MAFAPKGGDAQTSATCIQNATNGINTNLTTCGGWHLLSNERYPGCTGTSNREVPFGQNLTLAQCYSEGLLYVNSRLSSSLSVGILYRQNGFCVVQTCLNHSNPHLEILPTNLRGAVFHIFLEQRSDYLGCTDAFSCSGNGVVISDDQPCRCNCSLGYSGASCSQAVTLTDTSSILFATEERLSSAEVSTLEYVFRTVLESHGAFTNPSLTIVGAQADFATSQEHTTYLVRVTSGDRTFAQAWLSTSPIQTLLLQAVRTVMNVTIRDIVPNAATSVDRQAQCTTTAVAPGSYQCVVTPIVDTITGFDAVRANPVVADVTATYLGANLTATIRSQVNDTFDEVGQSRDRFQTCPITWRGFNRAFVPLTRRTDDGFNWTFQLETTDLCNSSTPTLIVDYRIITPPPNSDLLPSDVNAIVKVESSLPMREVSIVIIGLVFALLVAAAGVAVWFTHKEEWFALRGVAIFATVAVTFGWMAFIASMADAREISASHHLHIDEFASPNCENSIAPVPVRVSRVTADGQCRKFEAVGAIKGAYYAKARCDTGVGSVTSTNVRVAFGTTVEECESSDFQQLRSELCYGGSTVFPRRFADEQHFLLARCQPEVYSEQRFSYLRTYYHSLRSSARPVGASPGATAFLGGTPVTFASPNGITGSPSKATIPLGSSLPSSVVAQQKGINPLSTQDNTTQISTYGLVFNGAGNPRQYPDASGYRGALRYEGIKGSTFDVGAMDSFTLTFWMLGNNRTRGFVLISTDNRQLNSRAPTVERIIRILTGEPLPGRLNDPWNVYFGVYADAAAATLSFVFTDSTAGAKVQEQKWDLRNSKINAAEDVFGDKWSMLAITVAKIGGRIRARLFVNGRTSYSSPQWLKCMNSGHSMPAVKDLPGSVAGESAQETVLQGGLLYIGYLNAGVFDVEIHDSTYEQRRIVHFGTPETLLSVSTATQGSQVVGFSCFAIALIAIFHGLYSVVHGVKGQLSNDEAILLTYTEEEKGNLDHEKASRLRRGAAVSRGPSSMKHIVLVLLSVFQGMAAFMDAWEWPENFVQMHNVWLHFFSFDWDIAFGLPPFYWTVFTVIVASGVAAALLSIMSMDNDWFDAHVHADAAEALVEEDQVGRVDEDGEWEPTDMPKLRLNFGTEHADIDPDNVPDLVGTIGKLLLECRGTEAKTHRLLDIGLREKGRLFGSGKLSFHAVNHVKVVRPTGTSKEVTAKLAFFPLGDYSLGDPEEVDLTCTLDHPVGKCPMHQRTLMPATDRHKYLRLSHKRPYECAYSRKLGLEGLVYHLLNGREEMCPSIDGCEDKEFWVCPAENCPYCECSCCATGHSATDREYVGLLSSSWIDAIGSIVAFAFFAIYVPVIKDALMALWCHEHFQCDYPQCYGSPTTSFVIFVAIAAMGILLFCLGLPLALVRLLWQRRAAIESRLPELFVKTEKTITMDKFEWCALQGRDRSLLHMLYQTVLWGLMFVLPIGLLLKAVGVTLILSAEKNSLPQIVAAEAVEIFGLILFTMMDPFADHWIGFLTTIASAHQLIQLGLMCFHRVDIYSDPNTTIMSFAMTGALGLFAVVAIVVIVCAVLYPMIRDRRERKAAKQSSSMRYRISPRASIVLPSPDGETQALSHGVTSESGGNPDLEHAEMGEEEELIPQQEGPPADEQQAGGSSGSAEEGPNGEGEQPQVPDGEGDGDPAKEQEDEAPPPPCDDDAPPPPYEEQPNEEEPPKEATTVAVADDQDSDTEDGLANAGQAWSGVHATKVDNGEVPEEPEKSINDDNAEAPSPSALKRRGTSFRHAVDETAATFDFSGTFTSEANAAARKELDDAEGDLLTCSSRVWDAVDETGPNPILARLGPSANEAAQVLLENCLWGPGNQGAAIATAKIHNEFKTKAIQLLEEMAAEGPKMAGLDPVTQGTFLHVSTGVMLREWDSREAAKVFTGGFSLLWSVFSEYGIRGLCPPLSVTAEVAMKTYTATAVLPLRRSSPVVSEGSSSVASQLAELLRIALGEGKDVAFPIMSGSDGRLYVQSSGGLRESWWDSGVPRPSSLRRWVEKRIVDGSDSTLPSFMLSACVPPVIEGLIHLNSSNVQTILMEQRIAEVLHDNGMYCRQLRQIYDLVTQVVSVESPVAIAMRTEMAVRVVKGMGRHWASKHGTGKDALSRCDAVNWLVSGVLDREADPQLWEETIYPAYTEKFGSVPDKAISIDDRGFLKSLALALRMKFDAATKRFTEFGSTVADVNARMTIATMGTGQQKASALMPLWSHINSKASSGMSEVSLLALRCSVDELQLEKALGSNGYVEATAGRRNDDVARGLLLAVRVIIGALQGREQLQQLLQQWPSDGHGSDLAFLIRLASDFSVSSSVQSHINALLQSESSTWAHAASSPIVAGSGAPS